MTSAEQIAFRDALIASPSLFPLNLDPSGNFVQLINLSEADYQAASFLDSRMLGPRVRHATVPWIEFELAAAGLTSHCDFIFHISHVGSTLLSRLLGSHPACFSMREPAILRLIGQGTFQDRLETFLGLWSRTFYPTQRALIKATSFVSEIAIELLSRESKSRALLMYVPLETFLPSLLDGAMSDISAHAETRLRRIQSRGILSEHTIACLSPGECVAMSWLSEMISLTEVAKRFPDKTLWIDFDQFLNHPENHLISSFEHLGINTDVSSILSGPTMRRYAKKQEVNYDASFRSKLLAQAQKKCADEIARGLAWLDRLEPSSVKDYSALRSVTLSNSLPSRS